MRPSPARRLLTSYALTLFMLGVLVILLALVGRVAQEFQHRVIFESMRLPHRLVTGGPPLPPLAESLDRPGSRFVTGGFLVGLVTLSSGGVLWFLGGRPDTPDARTWTVCGSLIACCLLISMGATMLIANPNGRLVLIVVPSVLALLLFVVLVYLVAEHTLLAG